MGDKQNCSVNRKIKSLFLLPSRIILMGLRYRQSILERKGNFLSMVGVGSLPSDELSASRTGSSWILQ